ncbi:MAG: 2Fe-2S iron-sulfur cluster-binding protein [Candidatus Hydrogenedentes bacterium]|nr:2Fe-2S iron-sulfur cluster-binding protein [Candidatus Hydrogenedentota bacterium]
MPCAQRHRIPSSCQTGVCQICRMQALDGPPPRVAQEGVDEALQGRGYFLSCMCVSEKDMEVSLGDIAPRRVAATIVSVRPLSSVVALVRVMPESPFDCRAGQSLNLMREDGLSKSYSVANISSDGGTSNFMFP